MRGLLVDIRSYFLEVSGMVRIFRIQPRPPRNGRNIYIHDLYIGTLKLKPRNFR